MAVKALLHYALEVPDQTVGERFYTGFGLLNEPARDGAVRLRPAPLKRESVLLYGGPSRSAPRATSSRRRGSPCGAPVSARSTPPAAPPTGASGCAIPMAIPSTCGPSPARRRPPIRRWR
jgi:hypothetical protein